MFRYYSKYFNIENINWKDYLIFSFSQIAADHIINCHQLFFKIIKRFVVFRLRIINKKNINKKILMLRDDMIANLSLYILFLNKFCKC